MMMMIVDEQLLMMMDIVFVQPLFSNGLLVFSVAVSELQLQRRDKERK